MDFTAKLEQMLTQGQDSAPLRFALASHYLQAGQNEVACEHAQAAVVLDAEYSAAWKLLGNAQRAAGRTEAAADSYRQGIAVAERRGDRQAAKEMQVFLKRLAAR